jgi:hypothetical protein
VTTNRTVLRHISDEGARLRPIDSRGDAIAQKESSPMSFPFPHPRFPGKSREYVEAYLEEEAKLGLAPRTDERRRDVIESRDDAEVRADAEHSRRLAAPYYESFGQTVPPVEHFMQPKRRHDGGGMSASEYSDMIAGITPRREAVSETRIDSMAAEARVDADDVRRLLFAKSSRPTERDVEDAVHTLRLAKDAQERWSGR